MAKIKLDRTASSVVWSAVERFSVQAIQFIMNVILARLIIPSDFGLIAMLNVFIVIAQTFVDSGFSNALIQKKDKTESDYTTVFIFNVFVSVLAYLILFFASPFIASFYHEESLCLLCRIVGLSLIIQGLSVIQIAKVSIDLNFKALAKSSLVSVIISGLLGVSTAYLGFGVWALVIQILSNALLNTILLFILVKWFPKDKFSLGSLKTMFSFGSKLLVSGLLHTIYTNLYSLVIGRKYSSTDVGYYNQSNVIARFPSVSLMAVITRAIYPVQCELQDDDSSLRSSFYNYLTLSCFIVFPIMFFLTVSAEPLVAVVLTEKWIPSVPYLQLLCVSNVFNAVIANNNQMLKVKGRTDLYLQAEIIKKIVGVCILVATIRYGLIYICLGIIIYNILDMVIICLYTKITISISFWDQLKRIFPILTTSVITASISIIMMSFITTYLLQIIIGGVTYLLGYLILSKLFKINEYALLTKLISNILNR